MRHTAIETIKDISYQNGRRVAMVEQVISRADDCAKMGELYLRMSDLYRRMEDDITEEERAAIAEDLKSIKAEMAVYTGYLEGYGV